MKNFAPLLGLVLVLAGCGRREERVRHYVEVGGPPLASRAAAARDGMGPMMAALQQGAAGAPALAWRTPDGWTEQPAGGMRLASFTLPGAECAIISFPGVMAGAEGKIRMWLSQLGGAMPADPAIAAFIDAPRRIKTDGGFDCALYDFSQLVGAGAPASIVAGLLTVEGSEIAVRLKGPPAVLAEHAQAFAGLCQSLKRKE